MGVFSDLRREAGFSLQEAAENLNLSVERVLEYENGARFPRGKEIQILKGFVLGRFLEEPRRAVSAPLVIRRHKIRSMLIHKVNTSALDSFEDSAKRLVTQNQSALRLPHPIPYQGSKRNLAPLIAPLIPARIETWFEPFAGSAAMTLWAAYHQRAKRYVIGDSLESIVELWRAIIEKPDQTANRYEKVWTGQKIGDHRYFNLVRERYNAERDPVDLLYLICRCVKNAVRFGKAQNFTQSADKRRLGMQPDKMRRAVFGASQLLKGKTELRYGDWLDTTRDACAADFVYMDPPYLGTSIGRDKRYAEQMPQDRLIEGLKNLRERCLRFALSYDGMTGSKEYGPPLPIELGLTRLLLHAGKSSQSTLAGRSEETIESLYLTPDLAKGSEPRLIRQEQAQASLQF
jgi:DNA adenine methylase